MKLHPHCPLRRRLTGCVSTGAESSSVLPQSLQVGLLAFDRFRPVLALALGGLWFKRQPGTEDAPRAMRGRRPLLGSVGCAPRAKLCFFQ